MERAVVTLLLLLVNSRNGLVSSSLTESDEGTLLSVAVLFRHGDRAPKTSFPTDQYYDTAYWPMGFSQLTNQGKRRHYDLGKWLRTRYSSFLPDIFSPEDIYVRSSDVDRTLMSAEANLAGLYPPVASQIWTYEQNWQPIPIHTLPKKKDLVISMKGKCKKYKKQLAKLDDDEFFVNINKEHAELYEYLSNYTGWEVDDISFVQDLQSNFYTYRIQNASFIPSWADSLDNDVMDYLAGLSMAKDTYTEVLKRLRIGPFFYFLLSHFDDVIDEVEDTPKFLMLSGHESTVAAVLNGMGAFDYVIPEFASTIIWELRLRENGTYVISVYYKKEAGLSEIALEGCVSTCEYDTYKGLLEPITISDDDWDDECSS